LTMLECGHARDIVWHQYKPQYFCLYSDLLSSRDSTRKEGWWNTSAKKKAFSVEDSTLVSNQTTNEAQWGGGKLASLHI